MQAVQIGFWFKTCKKKPSNGKCIHYFVLTGNVWLNITTSVLFRISYLYNLSILHFLLFKIHVQNKNKNLINFSTRRFTGSSFPAESWPGFITW